MCGILGFYNLSIENDRLRAAVSSMQHRGPDNQQFIHFKEDQIGLGHTRLTILDQNERSNQPMTSPDGRYTIVYNGEIYNFRELKAKYNIETETTSDTEIVLKLFILQGTDFIHECNGMFAMAILDNEEKSIHIYRDRLGIKPLYYFHNGKSLAFASELNTLKILLPGLKVNKSVIPDFLQLGFIPSPYSWYSNVLKLPPGCCLIYSAKYGIEVTPFWELKKPGTGFQWTDEKRAKETLSALISSSIEYRLIADVPVGAFLSGGIDSSIVAAFAKKHSPGKLMTFSIGFKDTKYDERKYAEAVARHLGTEHTSYVYSEKDLINEVGSILDLYGEPFSDSSTFPTMLVSKIAREQVKVALSGDGGDEQFMGYNSYRWANRLSNPIIYNFRNFGASLLAMKGDNRSKRVAELLKIPDKQHFYQHIFSQEQYFFSDSEISQLMLSPGSATLLFHDNLDQAAQKQAYFDLKYYLPDDLLMKIDHSSMKHSLEVRVPLLDYRIVEFTQQLPLNMKLRNGQSKYLLKQVLFDELPQKLFNRPKWGFAVPLQRWLTKDLHYLIDDYLNETRINETGIFKFNVINELIKRFDNGDHYLYNRLWVLILVQMALTKGTETK
ncbi:asparagine synthase (glutamine-hydrolyzing) [Fulvivirga sedimenti]|uniref:asparagine synthase (glutamine-hydrolyzing) n=1 Tax=Fulvivirga sedimenti TaxID=2879465 RepID=A0A9X1HXP0_9BACT|nr:asparagine synthase (glutamine-hydrolyzing) [Fulvivirga sedimenti]MCA6078359.1 asparagine synthase (glutamine-hydrolyzing) [Fulvivirga sedimenti]